MKADSRKDRPQSVKRPHPRRHLPGLDGGVHWRSLLAQPTEVRRNASDLTKRAEALADEKKYAEAAELLFALFGAFSQRRRRPAAAQELFEKSSHGTRAIETRAIELYQSTLASPGIGLTAEKRIKAQRRVCELLIEQNDFALALAEINGTGEDGAGKDKANKNEPLSVLEQKALADKPEQWRAPGLKGAGVGGKVPRKQHGGVWRVAGSRVCRSTSGKERTSQILCRSRRLSGAIRIQSAEEPA